MALWFWWVVAALFFVILGNWSPRKTKLSVVSFIFLFTISSCQELSLVKTLSDFEKANISIPSEMLYCDGDSISLTQCPKPPLFVAFISADECSPCFIETASIYGDVFDLGNKYGFSTMLILSPDKGVMQYCQDLLAREEVQVPLWLDLNNEFAIANAEKIPEDHRFHYFLLNEDYSPIVVGNPLNHKVKRAIIKARNK